VLDDYVYFSENRTRIILPAQNKISESESCEY